MLQRRWRLLVGTCAAALSILLMPTEAAANDGLSICPETRILDNSSPIGFPAQLAPGIYEVTLSVNDSYPDRKFANSEEQSREQVRLLFYTADGTVATEPTPDLPDGVAEAEWEGRVGQITLTTQSTGLELVHAFPDGYGANSVNVRCISIYRVVEIPMFSPLPAGTIAIVGAVGWLFHQKAGQ